MNKTILITGVAGLVGSRLADWIIENHPEYDVLGIDDLSGGYESNINPKVKFIKMDVNNKSALDYYFNTYKPTYVYHFAAYAAEGLSPFIRTYNYNNNLVATANVVNNCIKYNVERLIFTSTLAVYGHGKGGIFDETQTPAPIDPYGVAKYACEMDIQIAGEQHGLDWCILRPHNIYGRNQNIWDKYRNVLGIWMNQYINHQPLTIYGDGNQTRAFSYIDDILEPMWNAASRPEASKQIINLGGIVEYSINKAAEIMNDILPTLVTIIHKEGRHEVKHAITTWDKSVKLLDFKHKTSLGDGIKQMWGWAVEQPHRPMFEWSEFELEKGLYSFYQTTKNPQSILTKLHI